MTSCLSNKLLAGFFVLLGTIISAAWIYFSMPNWPVRILTDEHKMLGEKSAEQYVAQGIDASSRTQNEYEFDNDYLNYGRTTSWRDGPRIKLDTEGLPMVKYGSEFQYNPVTLAQFALAAYGKSLAGDSREEFITAVEKLLTLQDKEGAFRYGFSYRHYTSAAAYKPGWTSGMAQGQSLSAFSRAYQLEESAKIKEAGDRALAFLNVPAELGGPFTTLKDLHPSLDGYIFFQEYITSPNVYTLNGYMFTLLGIYDWWQATDSLEAKRMFKNGMRTLSKILPYFDIGSFSTYDLSYLTHKRSKPHIGLRYHAVHIQLLRALDSVAPDSNVEHYASKWEQYVIPKKTR
jgi:hypothetical protein